MQPADSPNYSKLSLKPGDQPVPGYRLVRYLGGGGFGEVWEARGEDETSPRIALKCIGADPKAVVVEEQALRLMKVMRHPNLVAVFQTWRRPSMLVIGMELADGTLKDRLEEAQQQGLCGIPRAELLEYLAEAAKGIDHLNEHKHHLDGKQNLSVQHGDIKPVNLLLIGGGVKVADFGLAQLLEHSVSTRQGGLSVEYAAPEFFSGKKARESDQYSLAVSYCELSGGRLPFQGDIRELMFAHVFNPPDLSMLLEDDKDVVRRALAKEPKDRWPSCRAFVRALHEARRTPASPPKSQSHSVARGDEAPKDSDKPILLVSTDAKTLDLPDWKPALAPPRCQLVVSPRSDSINAESVPKELAEVDTDPASTSDTSIATRHRIVLISTLAAGMFLAGVLLVCVVMVRPWYLEQQGLAAYRQKDYDKAIGYLDRAIQLDPRFAWAFKYRGDVYEVKGAYDRAIADYSEAIRLDPQFAAALNNRGLVYSRKRLLEQAIADFSEVIRLDPKNPATFRNRAFAYSAKGDKARADADRNKADELERK